MPTVTIRTRQCFAVIYAAGAMLALSACTMSDDKLSTFLVAPDKYVLYTCKEIAAQAKVNLARQKELEGLMARANTDAGGRIVSSVAYQPDYLTARGEMNDLKDAAIAKHCDFVPGNEAPATRASDSVIH
jgi:hypothetical protein